jgi:heme exporter protein B
VDLLKKAGTIWIKDLRLEWRTLDSVSGMFFFSLLVLVIFNFTFDFTTADFKELGPGVLWVTFTFAGILSLSHSFVIEKDGECMQGLLLSPVDPGAIYLGKMLSNLTMMLGVEIILVPLTAVLFNFPIYGKIAPLAAVLVVSTLGFAGVGTLLGAMTARTRRGEVLLPLLLFSICVPIIIAAVQTTKVVMRGSPLSDAKEWFIISAAFDAVFVTASFLTFEFIIEE